MPTPNWFTGFEIGLGTSTNFAATGPDGAASVAGEASLDTTVKKSGNSSLKINSAGTVFVPNSNSTAYSQVTGSIWCRKSANPSSTVGLLTFSNGSLALHSNGSIQAYNTGGTAVGSAVGNLPNDTWFLLEYQYDGLTAGFLTVRVDGVELITAATVSATAAYCDYVRLGGIGTANSIWWDDYCVAFGIGASAWLGGLNSVLLLKPVSDNQRGSWTGGAGGTTNLWEAVNNTPPIGTATETDSTQIESADSSGDNATDEYRVNLTTYSDGGISYASWMSIGRVFMVTGEDVATGTKTVKAGLYGNPSGTLSAALDVAPTSGALGTYPTGWWWVAPAGVDDTMLSGVTVGNSPVVNLRKSDTGTRVASVGFIGMYVVSDGGIRPAVGTAAGSATVTGKSPSLFRDTSYSQASSTTAVNKTFSNVPAGSLVIGVGYAVQFVAQPLVLIPSEQVSNATYLGATTSLAVDDGGLYQYQTTIIAWKTGTTGSVTVGIKEEVGTTLQTLDLAAGVMAESATDWDFIGAVANTAWGTSTSAEITTSLNPTMFVGSSNYAFSHTLTEVDQTSGLTAQLRESGSTAESVSTNGTPGMPIHAVLVAVQKVTASSSGAGSAAGTSTAAASGNAIIGASSTVNGTATAAAAGNAIFAASGSAAGTATAEATGAQITVVAGDGSAAGVATASATGRSTFAASGASAGTATAASTGASTAAASASSAGVATAAAAGASTARASGASAGTSTAAAAGNAIYAASSTVAGTATAAATGAATTRADGASAGTSTAAATGRATASATGTAEGTSTAAASSSASSVSSADGASAGTSTAAAAGNAIFAASGSAAGTATAAATGAATARADGASASTSTAAATGAATTRAAGASAGVATAAATGAATTRAAGSSAGTSTAAATGASTAQAAGSAAGTSTAAALSEAASNGSGEAAGTSTAAAAGNAIFAATGASAGTATAAATGAATTRASSTVAGTATAAATGNALWAATGASAGTATAAATAQATAASAGSAAGTATAAATGRSTAASAGSAAGTATATAYSDSVVTITASGSSAGTSTVAASGNAIYAGVGAANSVAAAQAFANATAAAIGYADGFATTAGAGAATARAAGSAAGTSSSTGTGEFTATNAPTLSAPTAINILSTSVRPRVTITF